MKSLLIHKSDNGAALLTVLVALMIISLMTLELKYSAMVERKLAYNDLNQLQAYYLAKSGAKIGILRVALYGRAKKDKNLKSLAGNLPIDQYLDLIWNIPLPAFPPSKSSLEKLDKKDKDAAEKVLEETRISEGTFSTVISSESSKINLNYLDVKRLPEALRSQPINFKSTDKPNLVQFVGLTLINLIEGFIKDSENSSDEYGNLKPEEVVHHIMDWINTGDVRFAGNDKDRFYEQQTPPYKAKRGHFFTLEELRLVEGIDAHLFSKLKSHITVYSDDGKININTANNTMLKSIYPDFTDDDIKKINEEKDRRNSWAKPKDFADYVTDNLGRSGFKKLYSDENNFPFTTDSRSFIIESLGIIPKGRTQILKSIKVAVALRSGKGGDVDPNILDQATCEAPNSGKFWYRIEGRCRIKPTAKEQCTNLAASWIPSPSDPNKFCCNINNQPLVCPDATPATQEANQLKILSWAEI